MEKNSGFFPFFFSILHTLSRCGKLVCRFSYFFKNNNYFQTLHKLSVSTLIIIIIKNVPLFKIFNSSENSDNRHLQTNFNTGTYIFCDKIGLRLMLIQSSFPINLNITIKSKCPKNYADIIALLACAWGIFRGTHNFPNPALRTLMSSL